MAELFVRTTGNDTTGDGSFNNSYATVTKAHDVASAGDTISVFPGRYLAGFAITKDRITVRGYDGVPEFYGAQTLSLSWSDSGGNVWTSALGADPLGILLVKAYGELQKGIRARDLAGVNADGKFWYNSGTLYLYSTSNPSTRYISVDKNTLTGTLSAHAADPIFPYGGVYCSGDHCSFQRIAAFGWYGNGFLVDDALNTVVDKCNFSFNMEDGGGGFGLIDVIVRNSRFCWNGLIRARDTSEILPDGDGFSCHLGLTDSSYLIEFCYFEGNSKDATQNINGSTGIFQNCIVKNCNFNIICFATSGNQIFRNILVIAGSEDYSAIGFSTSGTAEVLNCTFIGQGTSGKRAVELTLGTVTLKNCNIYNWSIDFVNTFALGVITNTYNNWSAITTRNLSLGTGEIEQDPQFINASGEDYRIKNSSPCAFTGTDLSTSFINDLLDQRRHIGKWSIGCYEPLTVLNSKLLETALAI